MITKTILDWSVGYTRDPSKLPQTFVPAVVPGAVQLDWARSQGWHAVEYNPLHFSIDENVVIATDYAWMEEVYWLYRARLEYAPPRLDERLYFVCGGVDYHYQVRLNGQVIYEHEGMFRPFELDLSERNHSGDTLEVLVFPAPKWRNAPTKTRRPVTFFKPLVSYGWDFHPRLIPLGIWQDAYLEIRPACHIQSTDITYELNEDSSWAKIQLAAHISQTDSGSLRWRLFNPSGEMVFECKNLLERTHILMQERITTPILWWPNGQGDQSLYTSKVDLLDEQGCATISSAAKIGFRRVRLVSPSKNLDDPDVVSFPVSCNKPPITLEINGRQIFAKGSNWVSPDLFPGRITAETVRPLLDMARDANFNLLRCWGGAAVQKDEFFEMCDERGLMVWQEFPLACAHYDSTPDNLIVLDQESRAIILRLRQHPCVVLWCGGNELFNAWSRMSEQELVLRLLNRNCYELDPQRPFIMTSPLYGWAHGGYQFKLPGGKEVFDYFPKVNYTGYIEFGVPGPANAELLRRIIPPEEIYPPHPGTQWQARHAFNAWDCSKDAWLELWCIESYFGQAESLEDLIEQGQLLQSEGLKFIFEEARRQKPICSMALNWCFNEPWPTAANNSLVSWPAQPKPGLKAVAAALRPVLASARSPKFSWRAGEAFTADLYLLNDSPAPTPPGRIEAWLTYNREKHFALAWDFPGGIANTNLTGPSLYFNLPKIEYEIFRLELNVVGYPEWNSIYTFHFTKYSQ